MKKTSSNPKGLVIKNQVYIVALLCAELHCLKYITLLDHLSTADHTLSTADHTPTTGCETHHSALIRPDIEHIQLPLLLVNAVCV